MAWYQGIRVDSLWQSLRRHYPDQVLRVFRFFCGTLRPKTRPPLTHYVNSHNHIFYFLSIDGFYEFSISRNLIYKNLKIILDRISFFYYLLIQ